jgi:hypothetical protein
MTRKNRYEQIIEAVFFSHFSKGATAFDFEREEIEKHAAKLGVRLPKNLGDLIYPGFPRWDLHPDTIVRRFGRKTQGFRGIGRRKDRKPNG